MYVSLSTRIAAMKTPAKGMIQDLADAWNEAIFVSNDCLNDIASNKGDESSEPGDPVMPGRSLADIVLIHKDLSQPSLAQIEFEERARRAELYRDQMEVAGSFEYLPGIDGFDIDRLAAAL